TVKSTQTPEVHPWPNLPDMIRWERSREAQDRYDSEFKVVIDVLVLQTARTPSPFHRTVFGDDGYFAATEVGVASQSYGGEGNEREEGFQHLSWDVDP
ncbi:hypothetical protein PQX77_022393, partial [Marasmius sp. AFHP31]